VVSFPDGKRVSGKRMTHLVLSPESIATQCGRAIDAMDMVRWNFTTATFNDPYEAIAHHVTCKRCLRYIGA